MAITENLLPDETIVHESKKHWMAPILASLLAGLMVIGALLIYRISPNGDGIAGVFGSLLDLVALVLVVGGIGWIVLNLVEWQSAHFVVTTMRVLHEEGVVSKRSSTTLLASLSDVTSRVGFLGSRLGYGDLTLLTQSGDAGKDRFLTITDPIGFRNAVMAQKAVDRRGEAPAAAAVAQVGASPAPTGVTSSADADTLARLADLHDRGAITDAEFESKKAEILARM